MAIKFEVNKWYQFKNKQAQENFIKETILITESMHDV